MTAVQRQPVYAPFPGALMFLFDGLLQKELLQVDASRLRIVDAGQRSLILEPLVDLADGERTEVRVAFAEGSPRQAILAIVPHPSEVDTWINVSRHVEDPEAVCQARIAERCGAQGPIAIRRSALLGNKGVSTKKLVRAPIPQDGLEYVSGYAFRGETWVLLEIQLENVSDRAWSTRETVVRNEAGEEFGVRHVEAEREVLSPVGEGVGNVAEGQVFRGGLKIFRVCRRHLPERLLRVGGEDEQLGRVGRLPLGGGLAGRCREALGRLEDDMSVGSSDTKGINADTLAAVSGELFDFTGTGDGYIVRERLVLRVHVRKLSGYVVHRS